MPGPPPPPSRKPPAARPPAADSPEQAAAKPPVAQATKPPATQATGGYPPEIPEPSGMSSGTIVGIIAAILFAVIGLPILSCVGLVAYRSHQYKELMVAEKQVRLKEGEHQRHLEEQELLVLLSDRLYEKAKYGKGKAGDIAQHWSEPDGVRLRRWADWTANRVDDDTFEISGNLELGIKDAGTRHFRWACRYRTPDDPRSASADWTLEKITIDGAQKFP